MKFLPILLISILITGLVGLSNFDNAFAETKHYKIYHEPWPNYAIDYNPIQGAIKFWEKQRPDLSFSIVSSEEEANTIIHWVKEKGEHWAGLSYSSLILVELGDRRCFSGWNQFHPSYIQNIIAHEIGHRIGYGHETQSDSIMNSGGRGDKHYSTITTEILLEDNWSVYTPTCVFSNGSTLSYSVDSQLGHKYGFDVYIVPTRTDASNAVAGKPFSHYTQGKCVSTEGFAVFSGECKVGPGSYLVLKPKGGTIDPKITMLEKNFPIKQYTVYKQYDSYKQPEAPVSITLSINKQTYLAGDTIEVKGKVQNYKKGYTTFLKMNDPSNNVLAGTDIQLDDRGKFSYSVSLDKHKHRMDSGGSYSLTLTHAGMSEKTYFSYIPPETKQSSPIIQQGDVQGKLEFSNLQIVDSFDNPIESFALGEKIKVNVSIKNLQNRPQSYEYLAEMLDNASGKTITIWSKPGELKANQAIIHWVLTSINKVGHQKIIVSLLESADNPTLLAPPLEKWVYIQGNEPVEKIESSSKQKTNCLPGRESVDGVCKVIQTNEPEKKDADLMEQFKVIIDLVNMIKDAIYTQLSSLFRI